MTQTKCVKLFCTIEIALTFKLSMDAQKNTTYNNFYFNVYAIGYHAMLVYLYALYRTYV